MPRLSDDEAALLRGVCRAPADDVPRLVYADWLEEHGRPERAEFIRLQIEASNCTAWSGRWFDERVATLLEEHRTTWWRDVPKWARECYQSEFDVNSVEYRRGFPESLTVLASPFLRFGDQLLDRVPVTTLRVQHVSNLIPELVRCRHLRRVPCLDLSWTNLGDAGAEALAGSRHLVGVRELDLSGCNVGDRGAKALAGSRFLVGLEHLELRSNDITAGGAKALARSPYLRKARVDLRWNDRLAGDEWRLEGWFGPRLVLAVE